MQYFLAVTREGNISAAAQSLNLSQPSLSRQLKDLEDELGAKLFIRGNRRIELTEEGLILRKRAGEIMQLVELTESEISEVKNNISGTLSIGAGESLSMHRITGVFRRLKENYPDDDLIPEMEQDVKRLERIAERFSKIGSLPEPVPASLNDVMNHVIDYMDRRTSKKVNIVKNFTEDDIIVSMNASLFEWVIENLCKNAVDAMSGEPGTITLSMERTSTKAIIEVSDTGKGIRKKDISNVFRPGFTTKKRGWGLGLSLAKRIVEEYHKGHIFVKSSEPGRGTTFRIELPLG